MFLMHNLQPCTITCQRRLCDQQGVFIFSLMATYIINISRVKWTIYKNRDEDLGVKQKTATRNVKLKKTFAIHENEVHWLHISTYRLDKIFQAFGQGNAQFVCEHARVLNVLGEQRKKDMSYKTDHLKQLKHTTLETEVLKSRMYAKQYLREKKVNLLSAVMLNSRGLNSSGEVSPSVGEYMEIISISWLKSSCE